MNAVDYIKSVLTEEMIMNLLEGKGASNVRKDGQDIRSTCPIHGGDNDTAFVWYTDNWYWKCWKEDIGGDIFNFIEYYYDLNDFNEIVNKTAEELNLDISKMEIKERTLDYEKDLRQWLSYSIKKQSNKEYNYRVLGSLFRLNSYRHFTKETLQHFDCFYAKEMNRVGFLIKDEENKTIGASLRRCDDEDNPKWLHRPKGLSTGSILYNLNYVVSKGYRKVYLVEGIIDVASLYQIGIDNVVACFGARLTTEQFDLCIKHFDEIVLAYDNDEAGHKAIKNTIDKYKYFINISYLDIKNYKDVGEITNVEDFNCIEERRVLF